MCLIIAKQAGDSIDMDKLFKDIVKASISNPHGLGYAIRRSNKEVSMKRGLYTSTDLINLIRKEEIKDEDDFIFHARFSTRGVVATKNCHPFPIVPYNAWAKNSTISSIKSSKNVGLVVHNGIFSGVRETPNDEIGLSDTHLVCKNLISRYNLLDNLHGEAALKDFIGINNKLATLHSERGLKLYGPFSMDMKTNLIYSHAYHVPLEFRIDMIHGIIKESKVYD